MLQAQIDKMVSLMVSKPNQPAPHQDSRPLVPETIEESRSESKQVEKKSVHEAHSHAPWVLQAVATPEGANLTLTPESPGVRLAEQTSCCPKNARNKLDAAQELDSLARLISRQEKEKVKAASIEDFDRAQELKLEIERAQELKTEIAQLMQEAEELNHSPLLSELSLGQC